jgi:hypothetical protein
MRWALPIGALLAGACGRVGFDPGADLTFDARVDADGTPLGPVQVVQHASAFNGNATSVAVPLPGIVNASDILVVATSTTQVNGTPAVSDSQGNAYALAVTAGTPTDAVAGIYVATSSATGADIITCQIPVVDNVHCHVYEVTGLTSVVVASGMAVETGPSLSVSTSTPAMLDSYVLAYFAGNNNMASFVPDPGYGHTEYTVSATIDVAFSEDRVATDAAVQTATATASTSITFVNVIVALQAQ